MTSLARFLFILFIATSESLLAQKSGKTIVVIGSSTAFGTGASSKDSSWVGRLRKDFQMADPANRVLNLAVGGYTTFQLLPSTAHFTGRPLPDTASNVSRAVALQPDLVIINLPTNDIAADFTDFEIMRNYKLITAELVSHNIPFRLTSTQPRNFKDSLRAQRINGVNELLLENYGTKVINYLKKLSTARFSINPRYAAGDGVHLNNLGHALILAEMLALPEYVLLKKAGKNSGRP